MTVYNRSENLFPVAISEDSILWRKMKRGNEKALGQLYRLYFSVLQKHGLYFCKDRELVSDSIHELFSRLWTRRENICEASNVKVYLYRALERIIIAQLIRSRRQLSVSSVDLGCLESFEQTMIDGESRKQRLSEIKKCLGSLSKSHREVILLKFFNDLTYAEISEVMNIQLPSVYNLVSKAIEQLRKKMEFRPSSAS